MSSTSTSLLFFISYLRFTCWTKFAHPCVRSTASSLHRYFPLSASFLHPSCNPDEIICPLTRLTNRIHFSHSVTTNDCSGDTMSSAGEERGNSPGSSAGRGGDQRPAQRRDRQCPRRDFPLDGRSHSRADHRRPQRAGVAPYMRIIFRFLKRRYGQIAANSCVNHWFPAPRQVCPLNRETPS